jgi:S-adenosylmethionine:tRNA ribosyltransferase-isomerase
VGGKVRAGSVIQLDGADLTVTECREDGERVVSFPAGCDVIALAERIGHVPLPPYIARPDRPADRERYQTVFGDRPGSVAAPTASLHLTRALLDRIASRGIERAFVELAIGPGTFKPVDTEDLADFRIHAEHAACPAVTVAAIAACRARGGRVVAVGTTVVRTLETAARQPGGLSEWSGWTSLFLHPPQTFQVVDALLTNFHLPRSSLLMLVACRLGLERLHTAYAEAVRERYRFFSYGDAMLITP